MNAFIPESENQYVRLPGFCDVHVHFREPGFSYKETILTGTLAAKHGGYSSVCTMPNLNPVSDCPAHLKPQLDLIRRDAQIAVLPYGAITVGEKGLQLADLEGLAPDVVAFSDDGVGVQDAGIMREAMQRVRALGKLIAAHCEDMHYDDPREREWREIERNIKLSYETGCCLHICHISTCESVSLIREAKASHIDISCETAPHYLLLDDTMLSDDGIYKMNPPIHSPKDRASLLEAVCDGTVDMLATDHAPHSAEEKSGGFSASLNGIVGLETAFPVLYTGLVRSGILSLNRLLDLMVTNPRNRFSVPDPGISYLWDLENEYIIAPETFASKGKACPFIGWHVYGRRI